MHRLSLFLPLAFLCVFAASCKSSEVERTLSVGEIAGFSFDGNPTTGFLWQIRGIEGQDVVSIARNAFVPAESSPDAVGAGGAFEFDIKAEKVGKVALTAVYVRPWESSPPAKEQKIVITVR